MRREDGGGMSTVVLLPRSSPIHVRVLILDLVITPSPHPPWPHPHSHHHPAPPHPAPPSLLAHPYADIRVQDFANRIIRVPPFLTCSKGRHGHDCSALGIHANELPHSKINIPPLSLIRSPIDQRHIRASVLLD